jgi:hypothetical protein
MLTYVVYTMTCDARKRVFFVGVSKNRENMFSREFMVRSGKEVNSAVGRYLKSLVEDGGTITYTVVADKLSEQNAYKIKEAHIRFIGIDNLTNVTYGYGAKGYDPTPLARMRHAIAMVGKNTKDGRRKREAIVTLVSPDGTVFNNIVSIKQFAQNHGLQQSQLNSVALGTVRHHKGWRLPGTELPQSPKYSIRSPNGVVYSDVSDLRSFTAYHLVDARKIVGNQIGHPLKDGRSWHLDGTLPRYTFRNYNTGVLYREIVSTAQFAAHHGVNPGQIRALTKGDTTRSGGFELVEIFVSDDNQRKYHSSARATEAHSR